MSSETVIRHVRQRNTTDCLFHVDPASFLSVTAELCKMLAVPRRLRKRVAMATCSCRTGRKALHRDTVSALRVYLAGEGAVGGLLSGTGHGDLTSLQQSLSAHTLNFLKQVSWDATQYGKESAVRMAAIFTMAKKKDYSLLEKEHSENTTQKLCQYNAVDHNLDKRKRNFTAKSLFMMLKKRKRQAGGEPKVLRLPMFGGNVKLFEARDDVGEHFQKISMQFKPCVIKVDYESTGEAMRNNQQTTVLNIWCRDHQMQKLRQKLFAEARAVQTAQTTAHRQRIERGKAFAKYMRSVEERRWQKSAGHDDPQFVQEKRREDFERKARRERNSNHSNKSRRLTNTLQCINCYFTLNILPLRSSYNKRQCSATTANSEGMDEFDQDNILYNSGQGGHQSGDQCKPLLCRYHPGYEVSSLKKWSCCLQDINKKPRSREDIAETHNSTGCVRLQAHAWRCRPARKGEQKIRIKGDEKIADSRSFRGGRCSKPIDHGILFVKGNKHKLSRMTLRRDIEQLHL